MYMNQKMARALVGTMGLGELVEKEVLLDLTSGEAEEHEHLPAHVICKLTERADNLWELIDSLDKTTSALERMSKQLKAMVP